jgi:hypothetical protein
MVIGVADPGLVAPWAGINQAFGLKSMSAFEEDAHMWAKITG